MGRDPCDFEIMLVGEWIGQKQLSPFFLEGGFDDGIDGDILGGDEEGGGWDVGDEDLVLPADLVSLMWKAERL